MLNGCWTNEEVNLDHLHIAGSLHEEPFIHLWENRNNWKIIVFLIKLHLLNLKDCLLFWNYLLSSFLVSKMFLTTLNQLSTLPMLLFFWSFQWCMKTKCIGSDQFYFLISCMHTFFEPCSLCPHYMTEIILEMIYIENLY